MNSISSQSSHGNYSKSNEKERVHWLVQKERLLAVADLQKIPQNPRAMSIYFPMLLLPTSIYKNHLNYHLTAWHLIFTLIDLLVAWERMGDEICDSDRSQQERESPPHGRSRGERYNFVYETT